uniref:Uncharacterized protein n=1 Tax=Romanomermis culicivorax TaxID=13658 RepID=A0A915J8L0_ROMCU
MDAVTLNENLFCVCNKGLATNWDLDERYFYYLAFIQESKSAILCKRELNRRYINENCPSKYQTNFEDTVSQFKFYIKFLHQWERYSSAMIFNKASRNAITIRPYNLQDQQPPLLIVKPANPMCNTDQVLELRMANKEKFPKVVQVQGTYIPFYISASQFCLQVSLNKHSCMVKLINNSVLYINTDGLMRDDDSRLAGGIVYLLQSNE